MQIKIGYKVVDNMNSVIIPIKDGGVKYELNKKIEPNIGCGPLILFSDPYLAKNYASELRGKVDIYLCEYKKSRKKKAWCSGYPKKNLKRILDLTNSANCKPRAHEIVFADWVMLKEKI